MDCGDDCTIQWVCQNSPIVHLKWPLYVISTPKNLLKKKKKKGIKKNLYVPDTQLVLV